MTHGVPQKLMDGIIRRFDPVEVHLFGSRARGAPRPDSDFDLYVVVDADRLEELNTSRAIGEARLGVREAVDIVLATPASHHRFKNTAGAMARIVEREGVKLYERA